MMNIGDVDLNNIPDDVLLSLPAELGTQNYSLDPQHVQQQQHLSAQHHQVPLLHSQFAQHPPSQQRYVQQQQHNPQQSHIQQQQQQQSMHYGTLQQQPQNQYYSQSNGQSTQQFSPLSPSYPYQSLPQPPPYHSSSILHSPSHSVRNSSADIPTVPSNSLSTMAPHNHPPYSQNSMIHHVPSSSHVSTIPNPSYNHLHQLNRAVCDASVDQSYLNLEHISDVRQQNNLSDKQPVQQRYGAIVSRLSQNSNAIPQSPNSSNNRNYFDHVSPTNRPVTKRSTSLNSQQLSPNHKRPPYPVENLVPSSRPQQNIYNTDLSSAYPQGRSKISNNGTPVSNATATQARRLSNPMSDGSNYTLPTYVDIDNPFLLPHQQNQTGSTPNGSTGNRVANSATGFITPLNNSALSQALLAPCARVSSQSTTNLYNPAMNDELNQVNTNPHPNLNVKKNLPSRVPTSAPLGTYASSYPPQSSATISRQNINQQSTMAAPGTATSIRPAGASAVASRVAMNMRGAALGGIPPRRPPLTRGSATAPVRGPSRGGLVPPIRGPAPPSGQGPPQTKVAPPSRGAVSVNGGRGRFLTPATARGAPSGRGFPSTRGRGIPTTRGASSARGAPASRGALSRGGCGSNARSTRGRGRAQFSAVLNPMGFQGVPINPMESSKGDVPIGNPIQWYRMPDPSTMAAMQLAKPSGYHSDIEAMRAPMVCDVPTPALRNVQNIGQRIIREQQRPDNGANSSPTNHMSAAINQKQTSEKAAMIRLKQEVIEESSQASSSTKRNEGNETTLSNLLKDTQPSQIGNNLSKNMNFQNQNVSNTNTNYINPPSQPSPDGKDLSTDSHDDTQVDRKPFGSARDRVYSLWQAGKVVGRSAKVKPKAKLSTGPPVSTHGDKAQGVDQSDTQKAAADNSKKSVVGGDSTRNNESNSNEQAKQEKKNLFYVLFHGHKLICLTSGSSNLVLICQFQNECFADKGKGMVSNCINKALRIKKKVLDHPKKEVIITFLRNNGYLKSMLQHEPVHVMSLDDARRVYHFIYKIKNCSTATCVVEVLNQSVDLNIVISPSKRKILTQEMKMRIKREKKQADDERYGGISAPQSISNNIGNTGKPGAQLFPAGTKSAGAQIKSSSGSERSDQTLAYGECEDDEDNDGDDLDDVVIVEGPEDPYLLKWDGKQSKPGCVCNTIVGQVRSYHHEGDNFLVVSDLCRILGTSEFMTGIETDNVILYSCTKDILSFLNELSKNFPQLDTGQHCLVREKDVGVHATDDGNGDQNPPMTEMNRIAPLKRPLCKQEVIENDEEACSNPKQSRFCNDVPMANNVSCVLFSTKNTTSTSSVNIEKPVQNQQNALNSQSVSSSKGINVSRVNDNKQMSDDCSVIMEFDANIVNERKDKSVSETILNLKSSENLKGSKSTTGLSSPDSCLSVQSQDGPQSPTVLRQQKDPTQVNETAVLVKNVNSQQNAKSLTATSAVDKTIDKSGSDHNHSTVTLAQSQTLFDDSTNKSDAAIKSKTVVATVINIKHLPNIATNSVNNSKKPCDNMPNDAASTADEQRLQTAETDGAKKRTQSTDQDLLSKLTTFKSDTISKKRCVEDDLELSKLHVTSLEGLEEYRSRKSLLKEMDVLRFKNKTLQETLKALRDQLKKSKAGHEKSEKLATYYGTVIQEITATFKDGDKVEPMQDHGSGMSTSPICIDDDD